MFSGNAFPKAISVLEVLVLLGLVHGLTISVLYICSDSHRTYCFTVNPKKLNFAPHENLKDG